MKILLVITLTIFILLSCKKGIEHDKQYIRGRVFITDTITDNKRDLPAGNKQVLLLKRSDTLNFTYAVTTDKNGYFTFDLLSDNEDEYTIISYDTAGNHYYKGRADANRGDKNVVIILSLNQTAQNALVVYTRDQFNGILPSVSLKIYNNINLAILNDSTSTFATPKTDANGKGYLFNIPAGDYYINAEKVIDTATYQRSLKKIHIDATGFDIDTMLLVRKTLQNGFIIETRDSLNGPMPITSVYLFNSFVLASISVSTGATRTISTDEFGKASFYNLPAGNYFLNAQKVINDSIIYERLAKPISIPAAAMAKDTMMLFKKVK